jgi:hypothetical protein
LRTLRCVRSLRLCRRDEPIDDGEQLLLKRVEVEAEELFRILLLPTLYDKHNKLTDFLLVVLTEKPYPHALEPLLLLHRIVKVRRQE